MESNRPSKGGKGGPKSTSAKKRRQPEKGLGARSKISAEKRGYFEDYDGRSTPQDIKREKRAWCLETTPKGGGTNLLRI